MISKNKFMLRAIELSISSANATGGPFGCVIVKDDKIIAEGSNKVTFSNDPTAHAEIIAITAAANTIGDWRLNKCTLYVTKEPCPMCAGAIINSRLKMVVFGAYDEENGCCGSLYQLCGDPRFKTKIAVKGGILKEESLTIIKDFYKVIRKIKSYER